MKKVLVVVDYQNDFVNGTLGFPGAELLDSNIVKKIREYADNGDIVLYTMDTHYEDYLSTREGKTLPVEHCIYKTEGWGLFGETAKAIKDVGGIEIIKTTFGVSPNEMVEVMVKISDEIESVEFVGLVTNMCVVSNVAVFQAAYPKAQMIVDPNLCDSFDKSLHDKTIDVLRGMQVKIIE